MGDSNPVEELSTDVHAGEVAQATPEVSHEEPHPHHPAFDNPEVVSYRI